MNANTLLRVFLLSVLIPLLSHSQDNKEEYLKNNSSVLNSSYTFPQQSFNIIGFGAYHGSAKTEDAELLLLQSVIKNNQTAYYFPETDISIAHYFDEYLKSGDEELLRSLVETYGARVPQERTIEVFTKWKKLKAINDKLPKNKKITVLGADPIVTYHFTYRHLLSLIKNSSKRTILKELQNTVEKDTTDFSPYYDSYAKGQLKKFVADYEANKKIYLPLLEDTVLFDHLIATIKVSFGDYKREKEMFNNYAALAKMYSLKDKVQFFRLGFGHLLKSKEGSYESFFSMLSANVYSKDKIISVIGYLTKSEVIWEDKYKDGEYISSINMGDEGIGDSPNEYFRGIDKLKKTKVADLTIFRLNAKSSPYSLMGSDLIEVIETPQKRKVDYSVNATTDFVDYAILISNSPASKSIYSKP
ncbi:hypothetical protein R1T16_05360 [Flavobacterium sp. DG1-102-2]|uniref:hypothetical protein n=1 Tax=Flavobacterium sp. DG1-102-2 TaxID=3081663 RepID=UPI00294A4664|nr:hypothetical protein [Flavobacterium sp. DG1-102-2]MDV6167842.1 hypothetical protein [Flavobacterium sp. DG1-102-2]